MAEVTITVSQAGTTLVTIQPIQLFVGGDGGAAVPRFTSAEYLISGPGPYLLPQTPAFGFLQVIGDGFALRPTDYAIAGIALTLTEATAAAYTRLIVWMTY